jgi:MFS family permease
MKLFNTYRHLSKETYILALGRLVTAMGGMVFPMMTMILKVKMHMAADTIAYLFSGVSLAMIPLTLIGGKMADHFTRRKIIIVCDLISIIGYFYCAFFPLDLKAMAIFITAGLLQSMEGPAYSALVADLTTSKDRERAYSLNYLTLNLGMILSPSIGGMLFENHLPLLFLINGIAIGISTLCIAIGLRHVTNTMQEENSRTVSSDRSTWSLLKEKPVLLLFMLCLALFWTLYSQNSYLIPLDLSYVYGEDGALLYGTMSSLNCIVVVILTPVLTALLTRLREPAKLLMAEGMCMAGFTVFLFGMHYRIFCYLAVAFYTSGEILSQLSNDPYLTRRIPVTHRGRIIGTGTVVSAVLSALAQAGIGKLYAGSGSFITWCIILICLAVTMGLTVLTIRKDRKSFPGLYKEI